MDKKPILISFPLPPADPAGSEKLWAVPLDDGGFRIEDTPLFVPGISNGDVVQATDGSTFTNVVRRGGHSTYRIALDPGAVPARAGALRRRLVDVGCRIDGISERLYAVDVPAGADIDAVRSILSEGQTDGTWWYQEMHVGHTLP